jgi:hypothetical protein
VPPLLSTPAAAAAHLLTICLPHAGHRRRTESSSPEHTPPPPIFSDPRRRAESPTTLQRRCRLARTRASVAAIIAPVYFEARRSTAPRLPHLCLHRPYVVGEDLPLAPHVSAPSAPAVGVGCGSAGPRHPMQSGHRGPRDSCAVGRIGTVKEGADFGPMAFVSFFLFLLYSNHCKFKNLYKYDLNLEKYETNFVG